MQQKRILYTGLNPQHYLADGQVIHCPLIKIEPRSSFDPLIQKFFQNFYLCTDLIFTSQTSVQILKNYLPLFNLSLQDWESKRSIAIGKATGAYLQTLRIHPFLIAKEETAEGLVQELKTLPLQKSLFFWPHSTGARSVLIDFFNHEKLNYYACPFYETQTYPYQSAHLPALEDFDEVVFTSPSTVHAFAQLFGFFPQQKKYTCIGPITQQCLQKYFKPLF
jgi:uroporphyrinogen-III synthase